MNESKLAYWLKSAALDTRSIHSAIKTIRMIRGHVSPGDLQVEKDSLCFWIEQRRVSRSEVRRLKAAADVESFDCAYQEWSRTGSRPGTFFGTQP
jgi:hypothetical protein